MSIEAMKQALEALEAHADIGIKSDKTIAALRTAIEQAEKREWVGLTEKDFSAINQSCLTKLQAATSAESILREKNT